MHVTQRSSPRPPALAPAILCSPINSLLTRGPASHHPGLLPHNRCTYITLVAFFLHTAGLFHGHVMPPFGMQFSCTSSLFLFLALCPNITSSGIRFATTTTPERLESPRDLTCACSLRQRDFLLHQPTSNNFFCSVPSPTHRHANQAPLFAASHVACSSSCLLYDRDTTSSCTALSSSPSITCPMLLLSCWFDN